MKINDREISERQPPYMVAEISGNHGGSLSVAIDLIRAAKVAGADAVKIQAYEPDSITIDCDRPEFIIKDGIWKGRKLYELYASAHTPLKWLPDLFAEARAEQITLFASVFDKKAVDHLERLDCPAYKIASMEITDTSLIRYAANTGKPMVVSTGMASMDEICEAVNVAGDAHGDGNVAILHCVSGYPTETKNANLYRLAHLRDCFHLVGLSDHSLGDAVPIAATALGAVIIEKHLMLEGTNSEDSQFSLTSYEFNRMAVRCRSVWMGCKHSDVKESRQLRRSLYVVKDIKAGELISTDNVRSIRPSGGLFPAEIDVAIGRPAKVDIARGTPLTWDLI